MNDNVASSVKTLPSNASLDQILTAVAEDGAVIVEDFINPSLLARLNGDLDKWFGKMNAGEKYKNDEAALLALGTKTKRIQGLPARSDAAVELALSERFLGYGEKLLGFSDSGEIQYHVGTAIEIWPGEKAQYIHADECDYPSIITGPVGSGKRHLIASCMFALTDFTAENGATRVIPGSHKVAENWGAWDKYPEKHPTVPAVMKAGSAMFYDGKVAHGGGANNSDKPRRGMVMIFSQGWLKPMEASSLVTPLARARALPKRMQQLLGFSSFHRPLVANQHPDDYSNLPKPRSLLWHVDVGDASQVLDAAPIES